MTSQRLFVVWLAIVAAALIYHVTAEPLFGYQQSLSRLFEAIWWQSVAIFLVWINLD